MPPFFRGLIHQVFFEAPEKTLGLAQQLVPTQVGDATIRYVFFVLYRRRVKLYAEVFGMVAVARQATTLLRRAVAPC